jgi:hypothetical protein
MNLGGILERRRERSFIARRDGGPALDIAITGVLEKVGEILGGGSRL